MVTTRIPPECKKFLKLMNENNIEYLLIGGYAVNYYGSIRPTRENNYSFETHKLIK